MHFIDLTKQSLINLSKNKLRAILTTLGVVIGIGALVSMVSFGAGLQKNLTDSFVKNDLFTSLNITNKERKSFEDLSPEETKKDKNNKILNDSVVSWVQSLKGVEVVYPEISFPAQLEMDSQSSTFNIQVLPQSVAKYYPYNQMLAGKYFSSDSANEVVLYSNVFKKFKIKLLEDNNLASNELDSSEKDFVIAHPDSLIGKEIYLKTAQIRTPTLMDLFKGTPPVSTHTKALKIRGILSNKEGFSSFNMTSSVIIPSGTASKIPKPPFTDIYDYLESGMENEGYSSIYVRVKDISSLDRINEIIKKAGYHTYVLSDSLKELKNQFLIINSILGVMGVIALMVASLGIINTMLMSIIERTREIGIKKSIGGGEGEIMTIFCLEASFIGLIGGVFGNILGYLVTRVAYMVIEAKLPNEGVPADLFYFPVWLILGSLLFSILVSLLAGIYPALKAARIDPVKALRHD